MVITSYEFGRIVIDGSSYSSDIIIHPDRIQDSWRRREGHSLFPEDLAAVWASDPATLIVGTGYYGRMAVPGETRRFLEARGVTLHALATGEAVERFNRLAAGPPTRTVAAFHLTC